ncbi:MAG: hypothetical protein ACE5LB_12260 [Acidiferrobacterales bacterium]
MSSSERVYHVEGDGWYVETSVSPEGPFATRDEALDYLALLGTVSAARVACGWPVQSQQPKVEESE